MSARFRITEELRIFAHRRNGICNRLRFTDRTYVCSLEEPHQVNVMNHYGSYQITSIGSCIPSGKDGRRHPLNPCNMKKSSPRARLTLEAIPSSLPGQEGKFYFNVRRQKTLTLDDLAAEAASFLGHRNAAEVSAAGQTLMELAAWYLSCGFTLSTPLGNFRTTVQGTLEETALASAPDRSRLRLGVAYTMGKPMRKALDEAELGVEIERQATGPQPYGMADPLERGTHDGLPPGQTATPGQMCLIRGRNIKVGGGGEGVGLTLRRTDGDVEETMFFPPERLYPNTPSQVGFILPAGTPPGSTWQVSLCTGLGGHGNKLLKGTRTVVMDAPLKVRGGEEG